jgi:hypothetical protein
MLARDGRATVEKGEARMADALNAGQITREPTGPARRAAPPAAVSALERAAAWAVRGAAARPWAMPLLAGLASVAVRAFLVWHTGAMIDGDEAMVGIQAERILHGQFPTYFYGQDYMGVLEAYLIAPLIALFGPTGWTLRLVPIALSLLLVYLTWRLARALLPAAAPAAPLLAGLAALVAAVPPLYDAVAELRAWGGQIEVYVLTLALLLCAVELADRLRAGAGAFELARRWAILGFVAGLGIWINPLISYALVAGALWLLPPLVARLAPGLAARLRLAPAQRSDTGGGASPLAPLLALVPGLAVGGLPAWLYAVRNGGANLLVYLTQPAVDPAVSGAARHGRLFLGAAITTRYLTCVAPNVLDGRLPTESAMLLPLRLLLLVPPVAGILCGVWLVRRRAVAPLRVGLPLLYAGVVTAVFCLGTSAWPATKSCAADLAGRYAVPLGLVEPFLLLALLALAPAGTMAGESVSRAAGVRRTPLHDPEEADGGQASTPDATATGGSQIPLRDAATDAGRSRGPRVPRIALGVLLGVLVAGGLLQTASYALASPSATFQSPYYPRIPATTDALLAYLRAHDIHAAWCNHWLGNIITYRTDGQTVCADYYDQVYLHGLQRPPGTLATVSGASQPSFILILTSQHPCLARQLDAQNIPYTLTIIPEDGVTVITPARTVDPASVAAGLGQDWPLPPRSDSACPV